MATVQAYTKAGVDDKFNSRSNMTMVHNGGGSPDISAYPDSKTGDVIERSSDGARWSVVASTINPIAGRVVSVAGKTGVVTLTPGDAGAAPASHTHTKAQITDLNASTSATANTIAQRGTGGVLVVGTPTTTTHAATKAYVDSRITGGITWSNLSGKPSTFTPSTHTHTIAQISDLTVAVADDKNTVAKRDDLGRINVSTPVWNSHAATKKYVDDKAAEPVTWSSISGKPSTYTPSTHTHTQAQVTGLPDKLSTHDSAAAKVNSAVSNVSGSTTNSGALISLSASGRLTAVNPSGATDVANKQYVDSEISSKTTWSNTSGKPSTFAPSPHNHTVADITGLTLSQTATGSSVVQRDSSGRATVSTPTATGHATTKAYVDNAVTAGKAWAAITGKPSTFTPSAHTHTIAQISDLTVSVADEINTVAKRDDLGRINVSTPVWTSHATTKKYVDDMVLPSFLYTENLNDVTTHGYYVQGRTDHATTDNNYPDGARSGYLVVINIGTYTKQEYTDYENRSIHFRTRYGDRWYPWKSISVNTA